VEYTPQAYLQSDLDMFNAMYSPALVGKSPTLVSIAGGKFPHQWIEETLLIITCILGVVQNIDRGFAFNGESDLDLEYTMNLVNFLGYVQKITLYQVGDLIEGISISSHSLSPRTHAIFIEGDPSTLC
jgi:tripeptidyl-peptidase-1